MIYEIINPSDACTIEHDEPVIASLACLLLGHGMYALKGQDGSRPIGMIGFGGQDALYAWLTENGLRLDLNAELAARREGIATALESIAYGNITDRSAVMAVVGIAGDRCAALVKWNDAQRSSLNDMSSRAHEIAKQLRKQILKDASRAKGRRHA
jgi:hypothetical protein